MNVDVAPTTSRQFVVGGWYRPVTVCATTPTTPTTTPTTDSTTTPTPTPTPTPTSTTTSTTSRGTTTTTSTTTTTTTTTTRVPYLVVLRAVERSYSTVFDFIKSQFVRLVCYTHNFHQQQYTS